MCYFCLLFHTSDLIFQKQCSLSMWTRPENTCLVLIKKSERCRSYISTDYQGAEIELALMHIHAHKHWRWDAGSEICYSPCLFWRCFSAGESGMLVVPVWKTTAIKRAFLLPVKMQHSILQTAAASIPPQSIGVWVQNNGAGTEVEQGLSQTAPGTGSI